MSMPGSSPSNAGSSTSSVGTGSGTGSGSAWSGVGTGIVGGLMGLANSGLQYFIQRDLMDRSGQFALEQWRRETEYMSPKEQMKRLQEAGLNPDLAYSQLESSNGNMPQVSTPQAPSVGTNVAASINALSQARLADAQADESKSRTDLNVNSLTELKQTFDLRIDALAKDNDVKAEEINRLKSTVDVLNTQVLQLQGQIVTMSKQRELMSSTIALQDEQTIMYHYRGITEKSFSNFAMEKWWFRGAQLAVADVDEVIKRCDLLDEQKRAMKTHTDFFINNLFHYGQLIKNQAAYYGSLSGYYNAFKDYVGAQEQMLQLQMMFLPYQMAPNIFQGHRYLEHDKDGNLVKGKNGMPKVNKGWLDYENTMGVINDVFGVLNSAADVVVKGTEAYSNIVTGGAASSAKQMVTNVLKPKRLQDGSYEFSQKPLVQDKAMDGQGHYLYKIDGHWHRGAWSQNGKWYYGPRVQ